MNAANGEEHDPATSTTLAAACAVALVSFLPFARGVFAGHAFFFRDLSAQFFPLRQLVVEGLRQGELRFWNPYTHEGVPLTLLPLGYPLDLLQVLWPDDAGLSRLLALHVPLAALSFLALGRGLRLSLAASAGGALAYALGGFCLSTLNLYVYLQAMAWAPLIVLGLAKAATGAWRHVALAGVVLAVGLSTTGIEVVLQAIAFGMVLGWPTSWSGIRRQATAVLLGTALAAAVLVPTAAQVGGSTREAGLHDRCRPGPFGSSRHLLAGDRARSLRRSRQPARTLLGPELLPSRLPLHPQPVPRRDRSRPGGHGPRRAQPAGPATRRPGRAGDHRMPGALGRLRAAAGQRADAAQAALSDESLLHGPRRRFPARRPGPPGPRRESPALLGTPRWTDGAGRRAADGGRPGRGHPAGHAATGPRRVLPARLLVARAPARGLMGRDGYRGRDAAGRVRGSLGAAGPRASAGPRPCRAGRGGPARRGPVAGGGRAQRDGVPGVLRAVTAGGQPRPRGSQRRRPVVHLRPVGEPRLFSRATNGRRATRSGPFGCCGKPSRRSSTWGRGSARP